MIRALGGNLPTIKAISVVGLGKLGSCVAACLAYKGYRVYGVDIDRRKVCMINRCEAPVYEPRLQELITSSKDRLMATDDSNYAVMNSDITFIIVDTPSQDDGSFSLEKIKAASRDIASALERKSKFHVVTVTSTVSPGDTVGIVKPILESISGKKCGVEIGLCYNPEFIALGSVVRDFMNPDFILIGESDTKSGDWVESIYHTVCENNPKIARMSIINAELTKIALNAYVTMKISFANTLAEICEKLPGADVDTVTEALGYDHRIGPSYLKGGLSYGGPCFPRDNRAFSYAASKLGCQAKLARAVDEVNRDQVNRIVKLMKEKMIGSGKIAVLGVTYKPNTDVVEASASLEIIKGLLKENVTISLYDPAGLSNAKRILGESVEYASSLKECIANARLCIIATPWDVFKNLSYEDFSCEPDKIILLDCWRILRHLDGAGNIQYYAIGLYRKQ